MSAPAPSAGTSAESLPDTALLRRIRFVTVTGTEQTVVLEFADPFRCKAVSVPLPLTPFPPEAAADDAFDVVTIACQPKDHLATRTLLGQWMAQELDGMAPPLTVMNHGAQVIWRPGRGVILATADRLDALLLALLDFSHYESELRKLEREVAAAWPDLEVDTPLAYDVTPADLERHAIVGQRMQQTLKRRIRFARIESFLYQPGVHLSAQELGERLREKGRIEHRLETLDGQLEVFEHVYELSSQRISEFKAARHEQMLEWLIIVLLAAETLMLLADLLWSLEV